MRGAARALGALAAIAWTSLGSAGCGDDASAGDADAGDDAPAALAGLEVAPGVLEPGFAPDVTAYTVRVDLATTAIVLTATAADGASIAIAGRAVASGSPSEAALGLGATPIEIAVAAPGLAARTYTVVIERASGLTAGAYVKPSDATAGDYFGAALALAGDALAIGAPGADDGGRADSGAVYLFERAGASWSQATRLVADGPGEGDEFGAAIALAGDALAVGAAGESTSGGGIDPAPDEGATSSGAVYLFARGDDGWSPAAFVKADAPAMQDRFGAALALTDGALVVGAPGEDGGGGGDRGAAYVFVDDGGWAADGRLAADGAAAGDRFGASVAIDGDRIAVGAPGAQGGRGAVYLFARGEGGWRPDGVLVASNGEAGDGFGGALALSGDVVAVGAPAESSAPAGDASNPADDSAPSAGAAYVFERGEAGWAEAAFLKPQAGGASDEFGGALALVGGALAIGARHESSAATGVDGDPLDRTAGDSGAAYLFARTAAGWSLRGYLKASNTGAGDAFGAAVALSGDDVAAGAPFEASAATGVGGDGSDDGAFDSGAAYTFVVE